MKFKNLVLMTAVMMLASNTSFADRWEDEAQKADASRVSREAAAEEEKPAKKEKVKKDEEPKESLQDRWARLNGYEKETSATAYGIGGGFGSNTAHDSAIGFSASLTKQSLDARGNFLFGLNDSKDSYGNEGAAMSGLAAGNNLRFDCFGEKDGWCVTPVGNAYLLTADSDKATKFVGSATLNGFHTSKDRKYTLSFGGGLGGYHYAKPKSETEVDRENKPKNMDEDMLGLALNAGAFANFMNDKMRVRAEGTMIVRPGLVLTKDSDARERGGAYLSAGVSYQFADNWAALANLDVPVSKVKDASGTKDISGSPELYVGVEYRGKPTVYKRRAPARSIGGDVDSEDRDADSDTDSDEE